MRIDGWECVVDETGKSRGVSHPTRGNMVWLNGRLIGHGDVPADVVAWLIRPALSYAWERGQRHDGWHNPYAGEPRNKDRDPS